MSGKKSLKLLMIGLISLILPLHHLPTFVLNKSTQAANENTIIPRGSVHVY